MEEASNPTPPAAALPPTISAAAGASLTATATTSVPPALSPSEHPLLSPTATARRVRPVSIKSAGSDSSEGFPRTSNAHKADNVEAAQAEADGNIHDSPYWPVGDDLETVTAKMNEKDLEPESPERVETRPIVMPWDREPASFILEWGEDKQLTRTALDMDEVARGRAFARVIGTEGTKAVQGDRTAREVPTVAAIGISKASSSKEPPTELPPWARTSASSSLLKPHDLASTHKLYVIQYASHDTAITELFKALGVDFEVFMAHSRGVRYRQPRGLHDRSDIKLPSVTATYGLPTLSTFIDHRAEAVFDQASIWESAHVSILLLGDDESASQRLSRYSPIADKLEDALGDTVKQRATAVAAGLVHGVVAQLVHDEWLNYFEHITVGEKYRWQLSRMDENKTLCKDIAWLLEENLVASQLHEKEARQAQHSHARDAYNNGNAGAKEPDGSPPAYVTLGTVNADDWKELIARLHRMMAVLSLQQTHTMPPASPVLRVRPTGPAEPAFQEPALIRPVAGTSTDIPAAPPINDTPQGQSSLRRVTYMGGILLPFSIIAGIMSMSDPYGPGNSLFWIYWAITIPITCLSLTIIYADDIRNMYVYKQMSDERLQEAIKLGETLPGATGVVEEEQEQMRIPTMRRREDSSSPPRKAKRRQRRAAALSPDIDLDWELLRQGGSTDKMSFPRLRARPVDEDHYASMPPPPEMGHAVRPYSIPGSEPYEPAGGSAPELRPVEAVLEVGEEVSNIDQGNVELSTSIRRVRRRRRLPLNPMGWLPISGAQHPVSEVRVSEPVDIEMGRPSEDGRPSIAVRRHVRGRNIAAPGCPAIVLEHSPGGEQRFYRREKLGWGGALKTMVGYKTPQV